MQIRFVILALLMLISGISKAADQMVFSRAALLQPDGQEMTVADGTSWKVPSLRARFCKIGENCPSIIIDGEYKVGDAGEIRKGKIGLTAQQLGGQPLWILSGSKVTVPEGAYLLNVQEFVVSLAPVKDVVPVQVTYRQSMMGNGLVVIFTNRGNKYLNLHVTVQNKKIFRVDLAPGQTQEIGHLEGWAFQYGELIVVQSLANDFAPLNIKI